MLYLFYGDVLYFIDKEVTKIIKENNIDDINISRYEMDTSNFKDIIEDASTISMFSDKKMIIVDNAFIFTGACKNVDTTIFEDYFNNFNPDTIMIFKVNGPKIDERKKITKLIKKNGVVKTFDGTIDIKSIISDLLGDYTITSDGYSTLIERVGNDIYALQNETDKLKLYKDKDKNITKDDVIALTSINVEANLFKLMDAIVDNKKEAAITYYNEMLKVNTEPIQIIVALANKYRLMYQAKCLSNKGLNEDEIGKELGQNPKYIYVLLKNSRKYTPEALRGLLKSLALLDYKIKSGMVDKKLAFELFILEK